MMLTAELSDMIERTSHGVARAYRIEQADAAQEMWEWALTHEAMIARNLDPEGEDGSWRVRRALWNAGKRFALVEKAAKSGYSADDLYFYDVATIETMLPYALGVVPIADALMAVTGETETKGRGNKLPSEGNNFIVMVADVEQALQTIPPEAREFLTVVAGLTDETTDWEYVGGACDVNPASARKRYGRLLKTLQKALGGADPWRGRDRTGTRRVVSNAQARAITDLESGAA